ncbi:vanadium-dependent haloperoxidase [Fulvivirgaceae bacterium BMA10]|uniref:Vanadium-dependent haloperoxidase n=1 Tax=Splendidivirga corallicola TaxID=3051826 RepID=A0ABT8KPP9_9BACT|nr:vanadium-dependent haloperoxidase [Fulvivirgaceae bacterium BMA10]
MRRHSPFIYTLILLMIAGCSGKETISIPDQDVTTAWAEMTMFISQYTPANSPTYASRGIGYIGLTMYESIVHGYPGYQSMVGQLNGLSNLPQPEPGVTYDWIVSLNAGQAYILKNIYHQTSDANKLRIDSLERAFSDYFKEKVNDKQIIERSITYGRSVAEAIFNWSKTDGGHRGYLNNFDKEFVHPNRPGSWKPPLYAQSFSHHPLHPHWGKNRTFLKQNANLPIPEMIPYDTSKTSAYYQEFLRVYEKDKVLTQEEKEIAIWWGDDPDETFTPPGHSYYLATTVIKNTNPELIVCAETYARMGMAVADAFINCWKWKYHFFSERPNTFIPQFIDQEWESFWPDPPFPAFPSGHAIQAAAAATVLENIFNEPLTLIDSAHVGRERDEIRDVDFKARSFTRFWDFAQETADSRFYGGIHTPQDNRVGLEEGSRIASHVNGLNWRREN